ncbi:hypothetical protein BDF20DRAFT_441734 [Mycotypha africana]|uniref:uncharacterized protein n=1 Tax=Mycotypha africana TaxID=64632 RepID=UPI0023015275|nr:uncharacterized protein BDF20DRAFT_441734 [Mycotypha africana]KAI8981935.1 hypothetical protein BDF20DRAFT_441734 [Mycotypha africana]
MARRKSASSTDSSSSSSSSSPDHEQLPEETEERMKRMKKEPIHLVSSDMKEHYKEHEFAVRGSRGKTYNVTIGPKLNCTCRDHNVRGTHCKHILYALKEEMGVKNEDSPLYETLTPSDKELKEAFKHYHPKN